MAFLLAILLHLAPGPITGLPSISSPMPCYGGRLQCSVWTGLCFEDAMCHVNPPSGGTEWTW